MKVVSYSRVSTAEQASHGVSLDVQRSKIVAYCGLYELEIVAEVADAGVSAKSLKRPGIQRALAMLKSGEADGIVVAKLDRLTRNLADWQYLIEHFFCDKHGKRLFSVTDSVDTRTATGRMVLNMILVIAQWERETISERTSEAMEHVVAKGQRAGRLRFGFDLGDDGKTLIPNKREQEAIILMRELRSDGWTLREIADELDRLEIRTKDGKPWAHSSINYVLKSKPILSVDSAA